MLTIEPRNPDVNFSSLVQVRIDEPSSVSLDRLHNRLDPEATIRIEGVAIKLRADEDLQFCRDLLAVAEDALAWVQDSLCSNGECGRLRLAHGTLCPACAAEARAAAASTELREVA